MATIMELRINATRFNELMRSVGAKFNWNSNAQVIYCQFFSHKVEASPVGYRIPVTLIRHNKTTKKAFEIDGKVTIPYDMFISVVEYEQTDDDKNMPIGFRVGE